MERNVKADQIRAQQSVQNLRLPGTDPKSFGIRPGNVPENCDAGIGPRSFYEAGQECKMIILHKHDGFDAAFHFFEQCRGEPLVDTLIAFPIGGSEDRAGVRVVAQGP